MSSPKTHIIQSVVASTLLYPVIGGNVIPFGLAVIFIDIDHLIEYIIDTKSLDFRELFTYHQIIENNLDKNFLGLNIFHTFDTYAVLFFLGSRFSICYYILLGFLFHHLADEWALIKRHKPFARAFFILEYFIRKKSGKYITSIYEVIRQENLNLTGVADINRWVKQND